MEIKENDISSNAETENTDKEISDSILNSVKKLLGILPEIKDFDVDIILNINAAIFTLKQIGVNPSKELFILTDETQTYEDFLGEALISLTPQVKMYLFYKTKLGFDPLQSGSLQASLEKMIQEVEWRLNVEVEDIIEIENCSEYREEDISIDSKNLLIKKPP